MKSLMCLVAVLNNEFLLYHSLGCSVILWLVIVVEATLAYSKHVRPRFTVSTSFIFSYKPFKQPKLHYLI